MMDLLLLFLLLLLSHPVSGKLRMKCPLSSEHQDGKQPQSYYSPGDHLIAIVLTGNEIWHTKLLFNVAPSVQFVFPDLNLYGFSYGLRFIFNIQVINKNSQLLHNLTLGYNLHHNHFSTFRTSDALLDILSTGEANVPNYGCGRKENLLALLDAADRDISIQMSTLGGTYKVPQSLPQSRCGEYCHPGFVKKAREGEPAMTASLSGGTFSTQEDTKCIQRINIQILERSSCNAKGAVVLFYVTLSYMGFLAICFTVQVGLLFQTFPPPVPSELNSLAWLTRDLALQSQRQMQPWISPAALGRHPFACCRRLGPAASRPQSLLLDITCFPAVSDWTKMLPNFTAAPGPHSLIQVINC
ncbi:uncharacterized protein LOC131204983 [Ahaetulla prasina]|uniref:uncharacterized protein LOC131204983 n=1 Tax=Ahaetulla prasina TaxID=499056 RepID=UPI002647144D|nr:uncharacterized protein LOC131204983 [Ahaetulla prasina]